MSLVAPRAELLLPHSSELSASGPCAANRDAQRTRSGHGRARRLRHRLQSEGVADVTGIGVISRDRRRSVIPRWIEARERIAFVQRYFRRANQRKAKPARRG